MLLQWTRRLRVCCILNALGGAPLSSGVRRHYAMNTIINIAAIALALAVIIAPLWFSYRTRCVGFVFLSGAILVHLVLQPLIGPHVFSHLPPPTQITVGEQYALVYYGWCAVSLGLFGAGALLIYRHIVRGSNAA
jgi:hypothetical protein